MNNGFDPFSRVNDANVRRVADFLMQRPDRFSTIAVVASYIPPDLARELICCLPLELQARIAIEALTLRQMTREQVCAIDTEVTSFLSED